MKVTHSVVVLTWILFCIISSGSTLNILGIFPHIGKSHLHPFIPLMKGLAEKGHNITVISFYSMNVNHVNCKELVMEDVEKIAVGFNQLVNLELLDPDDRMTYYFFTPMALKIVSNMSCEAGFQSKTMQQFLAKNNTFDLIIMEFFNSDCFMPLAKKYNVPVIGISSCVLLPWSDYRFANPNNPSYIPSHFLDNSNKLTFLRRLENTLVAFLQEIFHRYFMLPQDKAIAQKYLGEYASTLQTDIYNASIFLINTHFTLNLPRPFVPNIIEIGGIHVGKVKPLASSVNIEKMKITNSVVFTWIFVFTINCASALNILGIFPFIGKSHLNPFIPLLKGLAEKGHNVTVISYYSMKVNQTNYNELVMEGVEKIAVSFNQLVSSKTRDPDNRLAYYFYTPMALKIASNLSCEAGFQSETMQQLLKAKNKFDLIITELFNSDCFLPLAKKYNVPVIGLSSCTLMPWSDYRFANPNNPSYIPNQFLRNSDKMAFLQRVENTLVTYWQEFFNRYFMLPQDKIIAEKYLGEYASTLENDIYNASVFLINTHFTLNLPRPLVPNIIEIGGIHIEKTKPLPSNLEKWISEAKDGVIYFSLGSMIKTHTMKREKVEAFIKAFRKLPQRVLWKWENETMEDKPDNVMIQSWMPQFDILSHPNVKAFISHGGLLGAMEAVHCGVPMIVMPHFGDQHTNAKAIEASGGGVILRMSEVTENTLYRGLKKILSSDFQKQAKELSERFRDRPLPPLETAIYWVEYVARHRGAPFMKTGAVGMPFYQYYLLDVFGFIIAVVSLFSYLLFIIIRFLYKLTIRKKTEVKEKTS